MSWVSDRDPERARVWMVRGVWSARKGLPPRSVQEQMSLHNMERGDLVCFSEGRWIPKNNAGLFVFDGQWLVSLDYAHVVAFEIDPWTGGRVPAQFLDEGEFPAFYFVDVNRPWNVKLDISRARRGLLANIMVLSESVVAIAHDDDGESVMLSVSRKDKWLDDLPRGPRPEDFLAFRRYIEDLPDDVVFFRAVCNDSLLQFAEDNGYDTRSIFGTEQDVNEMLQMQDERDASVQCGNVVVLDTAGSDAVEQLIENALVLEHYLVSWLLLREGRLMRLAVPLDILSAPQPRRIDILELFERYMRNSFRDTMKLRCYVAASSRIARDSLRSFAEGNRYDIRDFLYIADPSVWEGGSKRGL